MCFLEKKQFTVPDTICDTTITDTSNYMRVTFSFSVKHRDIDKYTRKQYEINWKAGTLAAELLPRKC